MNTPIQSYTLAETVTLHRGLPLRDRTTPLSRLVAGLTAIVMALALVAATSTPARADRQSDNLAKALAAIAVIGIIANQASKDRGDDRVDVHQPPRPDRPRYDPPRGGHGHGKPPRVPSACAIEIDSAHSRTVTVFGERCLREEGFSARLPQDCARSVRIYGQRDRIYSEQCLRDAGFRIGRR